MAGWLCAICGNQVAAGADACTCGARPAPALTRVDRGIEALRSDIDALQTDLARLTSELAELESSERTLQSDLAGFATGEDKPRTT
jgi:hypothetical protein